MNDNQENNNVNNTNVNGEVNQFNNLVVDNSIGDKLEVIEPENVYDHEIKKVEEGFTIGKFIVFVASILHVIFLYPTIRKLIRVALGGSLSKYVLIAYMVMSILFILISLYHLIKVYKVVKIIYILLVIAGLGYYGYLYKTTGEFVDPLTYFRSEVEDERDYAVDAAKQIHKAAIKQWIKDTRVGFTKITYSRSNSRNCENNLNIAINGTENYSVTVDTTGKIIDFKMDFEGYKFTYTGSELKEEDITKDKFVKMTDKTKLVVPKCEH